MSTPSAASLRILWYRFLYHVNDKVSFPLDLNFFLTQAFTDHGCLRKFLFKFKLFSSLVSSYNEEYQNSLHVLYDCPRFNVLRYVFKVTPENPVQKSLLNANMEFQVEPLCTKKKYNWTKNVLGIIDQSETTVQIILLYGIPYSEGIDNNRTSRCK